MYRGKSQDKFSIQFIHDVITNEDINYEKKIDCRRRGIVKGIYNNP